MTEIERRLTAAMHAAVDGHEAPPDLIGRVMRRHRRYVGRVASLAVVGVIVVVLIPTAMAARNASNGRIRPVVPHTGSASSPPSPAATSPAPSRSATSARREPTTMRGLPMPLTPGVRLLLAGRQPAWFFTATGYVQPITGLPTSPFPYTFGRLAQGWIAQFSPKGYACQATCPGPLLRAYVIGAGAQVANLVGRSHEVSAGNGPGRLWLESYRRGTPDVSTASATAVQVTTAGQRIGSPVRLPAGYNIQRAVSRYLLLQPGLQGPTGPVIYKLWDPATHHVLRTFANVIAASPREVAWGGTCASCAVHVLDVPTGAAVTVPLPAGTWAYNGTFSADGTLLALYLSGSATPDGRAAFMRIAVIDIASGRLDVLAGSSLGADVNRNLIFGWQGATHQLIAVVSGTSTTVQIASWRPWAHELLVRKIQIPRGMYVVLGEYG